MRRDRIRTRRGMPDEVFECLLDNMADIAARDRERLQEAA